MVFWDEIGNFGELILPVIALPGDLEWVVRQLRFRVQVPLEHLALSFPGSAAVGVCDAFELCVDSAFKAVCGCCSPGWFECFWRGLEIGKQPVVAR